MTVYRGQIIRADVGLPEPKLFLVVSNNTRNRSRLGSVVGARLTTSKKFEQDSIVVIPDHEFSGRVLCDDIEQIYYPEIIGRPLGGLSPSTMMAVDRALAVALALPPI